MKTVKFLFSILLGLSLFSLQSCDNAGCTDPASLSYDPEAAEDDGSCEYPTLKVNFTYKFGSEDLTKGNVYMANGTAVSFDAVQFYVAQPRVATDGTAELTDEIFFISFDNQSLQMPNLSIGHKHMLMFGLGVDSVTNRTIQPSDPDLPTGAPLGPQSPTMHWGWDNGYIFFKIDGKVDTDGDDTPETGMELHIGKDINFKTVAFEIHTDALEQLVEANVKVDISKAFEGVDIKNDYVTHTGDNPALAKKVIENMVNAFSKK